jgi:hypothetical protein
VTLIDRAEHHLFQPLHYQYATGILSEGKIASPLRDLLSPPHRQSLHSYRAGRAGTQPCMRHSPLCHPGIWRLVRLTPLG